MGAAAAEATTTETPDAEKARLLKELNVLTDQRESVEKCIDARKRRLRALMNEAGQREVASDHYGSADFSPRRSFTVVDREKLKKRLKKDLLVQGFKPNAALVDSMAQAGVSIAGIISIGVADNFSYRRPATKAAKAFRKRIIEESRKTYEAKVAQIVASLT